MEELILLDTSILIEYFRKTDKSKSLLYKITEEQPKCKFCVSAVTKFEINMGIDLKQQAFWNLFFQSIKTLSFDDDTATIAASLNIELKKKRKQIAIPDLFIAATALQANLKLATHNRKHFDQIPALRLV
jgi:tRNA(fMet)-specific endonuclease VapC